MLIPSLFLDSWFFAREFPGWINLIYYTLVSYLMLYVYCVFMHGRYGQTVGKMVTGVKLFALNEKPLGYKRALLREVVPVLIVILIVLYDAPKILLGVNPYDIQAEFNILFVANITWFVAELITMLTNSRRRALHDFIAGSVVVRL